MTKATIGRFGLAFMRSSSRNKPPFSAREYGDAGRGDVRRADGDALAGSLRVLAQVAEATWPDVVRVHWRVPFCAQ